MGTRGWEGGWCAWCGAMGALTVHKLEVGRQRVEREGPSLASGGHGLLTGVEMLRMPLTHAGREHTGR